MLLALSRKGMCVCACVGMRHLRLLGCYEMKTSQICKAAWSTQQGRTAQLAQQLAQRTRARSCATTNNCLQFPTRFAILLDAVVVAAGERLRAAALRAAGRACAPCSAPDTGHELRRTCKSRSRPVFVMQSKQQWFSKCEAQTCKCLRASLALVCLSNRHTCCTSCLRWRKSTCVVTNTYSRCSNSSCGLLL